MLSSDTVFESVLLKGSEDKPLAHLSAIKDGQTIGQKVVSPCVIGCIDHGIPHLLEKGLKPLDLETEEKLRLSTLRKDWPRLTV